MKFDNLYIECENLEQRDEVIQVCLDSGIPRHSGDTGDLNICVESGFFFDFDDVDTSTLQALNHSQFMQKYGKLEMKQSIEKAMTELRMGREELSCMLGFSRQYITKMMTRPQSEKTQNKVIKMIDDLIESVNVSRQFLDAVSNNPIIIDERDKVIKELNQALEYKDQLLARNEDDLHEQANRANAYKEDNLKLSEMIENRCLIINQPTSELLEIKLLNSDLSDQVEILKRKNKDLNIANMLVCVGLIALFVWWVLCLIS